MVESKNSVVHRYVEGATAGTASRFEIEVLNGYRCIVGYGWAVYAAYPVDGSYVLFGDGYKTDGTNVGWAGYSGTTTTHIQDIKSVLEGVGVPFMVSDARPERTDLLGDGYDIEAVAEENEADILPYTGYVYRKPD